MACLGLFRRTSIRAAALVFCAAVSLLSVPRSVQALDVNVSNYNWLQLLPNDVTTVFGSTNNAVGTGYGEPADIRWGNYVWLPTLGMTANATQMYYAGVRLDQSRSIESVRLQWYNSGMTFNRYYVDGSNDGTSWTQIGTQGSLALPAEYGITDLAVTPGSYQYVRARFEPGDYSLSGSYGGPGIMALEPSGDGAVNSAQVNWAHSQFGTTATNTGMSVYNSTSYNNGTFTDPRSVAGWTGRDPGNWGAGSYTTLNLNADRLIGDATVIWSAGWQGTSFDVQYSTDGSTFYDVDNPQAPVHYANAFYSSGGTKIGFDPVIARYIRLRNAVGPNTYVLMNNLLLHSPEEGVLDSNPVDDGVLTVGGFDANEVVTYTDAITLENVGAPGSAIAIFDVTITGDDAAQFDITDFAQTVLMAGDEVNFDLQLTTTLDDTYNATVTFTTNLGEFTFDIQATTVPEPGTCSLFGLGAAALAWRVRRRKRAQK